ncbi:MAG: histidine kinase, partial [Planctomycetota bacterium]
MRDKLKAAGGWAAIRYAVKVALQVGILPFSRAIFSKNACKTCALGMGGQQGGMINERGDFPEICKKSMQAQLTDIQPGISKSLFSQKSIEALKKLSGRDVERLGRLAFPIYKGKNDTHFQPISWEESLSRIIEKFRSTSSERTFFYSSGRSSNEAAFILQLFAR